MRRALILAAVAAASVGLLALLAAVLGEPKAPARPAKVAVPAWYPNADEFFAAWLVGNYTRAAAYASPQLGESLAHSDARNAPRFGRAKLDPEPVAASDVWVTARARVDGTELTLDVSWDGSRWVVANIEKTADA